MRRSILLLLGAVLSAEVQAEGITPFIAIDSFAYSEPIAINALFHQWQGSFHGGRALVTRNRMAAGVEFPSWSLARIERLDYQATMSREMAELIYLTNNQQKLEVGRRFELSADIYHLYSRGLSLTYQGRINERLSYQLSGSLLEGVRLTAAHLTGQAHAIAEDDYDFSFVVDTLYSKDWLEGRDVLAPSGSGYTLDLALGYQVNDRFRLGLVLEDLYGLVEWHDTPYTYATASSDNKTYDENGYVVYQAVLSGINGYTDYLQRMPLHGRATAWYKPSDGNETFISYDYYEPKRFVSVGFNHGLSTNVELGGEMNLTAHALGLSIGYKGLKFGLVSDVINVNDARVLSVSLRLAKSF